MASGAIPPDAGDFDPNDVDADYWGDSPEETGERSRDPVRSGSAPVFFEDRLFYRVIVCGLVASVILALGGSIWLAACEKDIPEAIVAMGSAAIGALASVLTISRR